jgi:hypothetical protein
MTPELFEPAMVAGNSPRRDWLERWVIRTRQDDESKWVAFSMSNPYFKCGEGVDEDDAIADWSRRNAVKLWNEVIA